MYLEHVDTGERILVGLCYSGGWVPAVYDLESPAWDAPHLTEGPVTTHRVWRLVYADTESTPAVPENRSEPG